MKEEDRCKDCKGEKVKKVKRTLEVAIQPGCPDMHDYVYTGENDEYVLIFLIVAWNHCRRCLRSSQN